MTTARLGRRGVLVGFGTLAFDSENDLRNLILVDTVVERRRVVFIVPKYLSPDQRLPLLVLLHGLGETTDERAGAYAWLERYGLGDAWQRLKRAPIERTSKRGEWTNARLRDVNAELETRPFRGFVIACPFMPNPKGPQDLADYAKWVTSALVPHARKTFPVFDTADRTYLGGVSLGGYVALEVIARSPETFGALGGIQTAIGAGSATSYATRIAKVWKGSPRPVLFLTSSGDTFRSSSEGLARAFEAQRVPSTLRDSVGPHDQPWLRELGSIETLVWFDRLALR